MMTTSHRALIADRFLRIRDERVIDLGTGEEVWLRVEEDAPASGAWAERCAALYVRRHPHLVELLDYGALGRAARFEAFRSRGPLRRWPVGDEAGERALQSATEFLLDHGLSPGTRERARVVDVAGWPRLLPDEETGHLVDQDGALGVTGAPHSNPDPVQSGLLVQPRPAIPLILDFLEDLRPRGPRWLHLRSPAGSGASTTLRLVAREVRLRGFVPIHVSLGWKLTARGLGDRHRRWLADLAGRHVVILSDRDKEPAGSEAERAERLACSVLGICAELGHPQAAVLSVSDRDTASPWVALDPLTVDQLVAMVGGDPLGRERASLRRAADAAHGWPGRFVRLARFPEAGPGEMPTARETAPACVPSRPDGRACRGIVVGRRLVRHGRHAAAVRSFREALGMCERRDDRYGVGRAWLELGWLFLARGLVEDAGRSFQQAGRSFRLTGAARRAVVAGAGEALAHMEAGRFAKAEAILQTSDLAATQVRGSSEAVMIRAALVRCLCWQGREGDAARIVAREGQPPAPGASRFLMPWAALAWVLWHRAASAMALHHGALDRAASHVMAALAASERAHALGRCVAHTSAVMFHGAIGDVEAVRLHAARALDASRLAHAPTESLRVRVALVSALGQVGAHGEARKTAARLLRRRTLAMPALLRAEIGVAVARALPEHPNARRQGEAATAFAHDSGGLALLAASRESRRLPAPLGDIVDVLRVTHEQDGEEALLAKVAELLRDRLDALTVSFVSTEDPTSAVVIAGSGRCASAVRAIEAATLLGPLRTGAGLEVAVPIRCAGATIGGLACRWSAAGPNDAEAARALIEATATMSGPFLKSLLEQRREVPAVSACPELLGISAAMLGLRRDIARAAAAPFSVLIAGESGVGKELVARAIHRESARRLRSFAALNCAALTEELVEAELFGHARGAFTGAIAERRGLFEEADGGTLFLDEVGELSPRAQAKLLRALQEGEVRRVGESFARQVDVRIVAATNRPLDRTGDAQPFRQDLRYRLDVIRIDVPALRHRIEDIPVLAGAFWPRVAGLTGCRAKLSPATLAALARYDWPGNVRELQNVIAALAVSAPRVGMVGPSALPASIARGYQDAYVNRLDEARSAFERRFVAAALARAGGRRHQAAKDLGVTRQGFAKLVKRLGIVEVEKVVSSQ